MQQKNASINKLMQGANPVPAYHEQIAAIKKQLFDELEASGGLDIPVRLPKGERLDQHKNKR